MARCFAPGVVSWAPSHLHRDGYCVSYRLGADAQVEILGVEVVCAESFTRTGQLDENRDAAWELLCASGHQDALDEAVDFAAVLREVPRRAVPAIVDCARLDLVDAAGALRCVEVVHVEPLKQAELLENAYLHGTWRPLLQVRESGRPFLASHIDDQALDAMCRNATERGLLARYGIRGPC